MNFTYKPFRFLPKKPLHYLNRITSKRNALLLLNISFGLIVLIITYSVFFHVFMFLENREFNWISGLYWTIASITTVGYGDIVFNSIMGQLFSIIVMITGIVFLLIIIPFTIVRLFQSTSRAPREVSTHFKGHVILTNYDSITRVLINLLNNYKIPYVLIIPDIDQALNLMDHGFKVLYGSINDPLTYTKVNIELAKMVVSTSRDTINTTVIYAVRTISDDIPIVALADNDFSKEILTFAGCNQVLTLNEIMGMSFANRVIGGDAFAHVIDTIDDIHIAEAMTTGTPMVERTIKDVRLRDLCGVTIVGIWQNGKFKSVTSDTIISNKSILVIAGSKDQIDMYNQIFCIYNVTSKPVIVIGAGKVGTIMGNTLRERDYNFKIIEKSAALVRNGENYILGNAMDQKTLIEAGIKETPVIAITTHNDETNLYIATICRHLNPDAQIICRATDQKFIQLLNKAGCEFVISYASLGASSILNTIHTSSIATVADGVDVIKVKSPKHLVGKKIADTKIGEEFGCNIIGLKTNNETEINPSPDSIVKADSEIIIIGPVESQTLLLKKFR